MVWIRPIVAGVTRFTIITLPDGGLSATENISSVVSGMASVIRLRGDEMRSERRKRSAAGK